MDTVAELRRKLWAAGFRPVPLLTGDKKTVTQGWHKQALQDPPAAVMQPPTPEYLNTGVLCRGLRVVDLDVDYPAVAAKLLKLAVEKLGPAPERSRTQNSRRALIYRAAEGEPEKLWVKGEFGKVEVLGNGQQLHAFGKHPSGAELEWTKAPGEISVAELTPVTEDQVKAFLAEAASLIGATARDVHAPSRAIEGTVPLTRRLPPSVDAVAALLNRLPNPSDTDYERYKRRNAGRQGMHRCAREGREAR